MKLMFSLPKIKKGSLLPLLSTLTLFLSIFVAVSLVQQQQELRGKAQTAGPPAVPTFHSIGLYWSPSGGSSNNNAQVQYRKKGTTTWRQGLDLWFDSGSGEYRGSLVHLEPATTYEIKLTLKNTGTTTTLTATTWSENFPIAKTIELPKLSSKTLVIDQSGSPSGYILYSHAPGSSATIDVLGSADNAIDVRASYVIIRGLTIKNARRNAIWVNDNLNDIVIEEDDISGWGSGSDLDSAVRSGNAPGIKRVIVQRNRMHHPRSGSNDWSTGHPAGPQGVTFFNSAGNHVIRYNEVYSNLGHYFNDILGAGSNSSSVGYPNRDSDIYGNYLANCYDDAIEAEGGNRNVRIWGNFIENCMVTIANRDTRVGPLYIWRNISSFAEFNPYKLDPTTDERRGRFLKAGGPARTYVFHNTMLQPPPTGGFKFPLGVSAGIEGDLNQSVSRNNIFQVNRPDMSGGWWVSIDGGTSSNDFDYDLYNGSTTLFSGQEANGVRGVPKYNPSPPSFSLVGGKGTFTLDSSSLGFDAGAMIPNFNDNFTGARPDIGAHEKGTPPMEFGVDAYLTGTPPPPPPSSTPTPTPTGKIPGDLDKDGDVDIFDYNILLENFGKTNCGNVADINGNCKVDIFDYNILVSNFGKTSATPTPAQPSPTPSPPPTAASCLTQSGPLVTISGSQSSAYSNSSLAANTKVDARTASWVGVGNTPVKVGGSGMCWSGGRITGTYPDGTSWSAYHDAYAMIINSAPNSKIEGVRIHNYGDSIDFKDGSSDNFIVRGNHISYNHDDCFENDFGNRGFVEDNFFDGCYVGYSPRSYQGVPDNSGKVVTLRNNLWRLQDMPTGYSQPGHGKFWKMDSSGKDPKLALHDNVFRMDTNANCCGDYLIPPASRLASCSNNVMVWLGSGSFPESIPSCFTLMTGQAGLDYWNSKVADWKARHQAIAN